jgi:hypothetical protein
MRLPDGDPRLEHSRLPDATRLLTWLMLAVVLVLFLRYQIKLLSVQEFGDESETVLTARMMAAGMRLYSEIFNHHGPLAFYPGWLIEQVAAAPIAVHRLSIAALQWALLLALWTTPSLRRSALREVYVAVVAASMVLFLPAVFGQMVMYQNFAGLLTAIALAVLVLPAVCEASPPSRWRIVLGALLLSGLPFLAFTFAPVAVLLVVAALRRDIARPLLAWIAIGTLLQLLMLAALGSLAGFAAFHLYLNLAILPEFVGVGPAQPFFAALAVVTGSRHGMLMLLGVVVALLAVATASSARFGWRAVAMGLAIGSFLMRGDNFHATPFWYAALALPVVLAGSVRSLDARQMPLLAGLLGLLLLKMSLLLPGDRATLAVLIPRGTEFARLAQLVTEPGDTVLAYSFVPFLYLDAGRLPASGNFFYTPWQARYAENPRFGIHIDTCADIERNRPKLIRADREAFWGRYPWESYAGCIDALLERDYRQLPGTINYVRRDLDLSAHGLEHSGDAVRLVPGEVAAAGGRVSVVVEPSLARPGAAVQAIGIRFATYLRDIEGDGALILRSVDGDTHRLPVALTDVRDNEYLQIDLSAVPLTPDSISAIELESGAVGGFSVWEADADGGRAACVALRLADGSRRLTPGCPIP